jgi:hypothetical protein
MENTILRKAADLGKREKAITERHAATKELYEEARITNAQAQRELENAENIRLRHLENEEDATQEINTKLNRISTYESEILERERALSMRNTQINEYEQILQARLETADKNKEEAQTNLRKSQSALAESMQHQSHTMALAAALQAMSTGKITNVKIEDGQQIVQYADEGIKETIGPSIQIAWDEFFRIAEPHFRSIERQKAAIENKANEARREHVTKHKAEIEKLHHAFAIGVEAAFNQKIYADPGPEGFKVADGDPPIQTALREILQPIGPAIGMIAMQVQNSLQKVQSDWNTLRAHLSEIRAFRSEIADGATALSYEGKLRAAQLTAKADEITASAEHLPLHIFSRKSPKSR